MRHSIQRRRLDKQFRGLLGEASCSQGRAKEGLEAKEGGFRQTAAMISRLPLPLPSAFRADRPQVLIALPGWGRAITVLPNLGVPTGRNHGFGPALLDRLVAPPLV